MYGVCYSGFRAGSLPIPSTVAPFSWLTIFVAGLKGWVLVVYLTRYARKGGRV